MRLNNETQKRFELVSENAAMLGCENSELKERLERAKALLRVLSGCMPDKVYVMDEKWSSEEPDDGDFVLVDFAAYFREEGKAVTIICLVNSRAVRVDQSPMNKERWVILFECGHEEWVTAKRRPGIKKKICAACDKSLSLAASKKP